MKKFLIFFATALISSASLMAQAPAANAPKATIVFDEYEYDFGEVEQGKATHTFNFVNTGREPIVVQAVQSTCGCTVPNYSKEPILPGKKGVVTVTYKNAGLISRTVTVVSNAEPARVILRIKGNAKPIKTE